MNNTNRRSRSAYSEGKDTREVGERQDAGGGANVRLKTPGPPIENWEEEPSSEREVRARGKGVTRDQASNSC